MKWTSSRRVSMRPKPLAGSSIGCWRRSGRSWSITARRILAWEGNRALWQEGLEVIDQPMGTLNLPLTPAFAAAGRTSSTDWHGHTAGHRSAADSDSEGADAALGLSEDGGFWAISLRYGHPPGLFGGIPISSSQTGSAQLARLSTRAEREALAAAARCRSTRGRRECCDAFSWFGFLAEACGADEGAPLPTQRTHLRRYAYGHDSGERSHPDRNRLRKPAAARDLTLVRRGGPG